MRRECKRPPKRGLSERMAGLLAVRYRIGGLFSGSSSPPYSGVCDCMTGLTAVRHRIGGLFSGMRLYGGQARRIGGLFSDMRLYGGITSCSPPYGRVRDCMTGLLM